MRFVGQFATAAALLAAAASAMAHEGHGLTGSHWHPTDACGFALAALLAALAIWLSRGE